MDNYSHLGKQPISDTAPAGSDVRAEDDYDLLQNEIAKMSNPVTSGTLDWQQVIKLSGALLGSKGKDIMVASYLTGGLLQTRGLDGLREGLQVLQDMLETYWDTMYPPLARLRARRNALEWLMERIRLHSEENKWSELPQQEHALIAALLACTKGIDAVLMDKDSDAPSMRPVLMLLDTIPCAPAVVEPEEVVAVETGGASAAGGSSSSSSSTSNGTGSSTSAASATFTTLASTPLDSMESAEQAAGQAFERLAEIAGWLHDAALNTPLAFRLNRHAVWSAIEVLPAVRNGQTMLPAPIAQIQDALRHLLNTQANEDLVRFAEAQLVNFPFWLDLNRVAAQALERLGDQYEQSRREVCAHTAALVSRLPGMEQLVFAGGMPFADGETQQWLAGLTAGSAENAAQGGGGAKADAMQAVLGNVRALAANNDIPGAAACLQKAIDQAVAPGSKFQLRVALCELLFQERPGANLDAFAHAIVSDIDRFSLTTWDPPLALSGLVAAYNILARNDEDKVACDALLARITFLDASAAVRLVTQ